MPRSAETDTGVLDRAGARARSGPVTQPGPSTGERNPIPSLDGLRALAVGLVIVYHLQMVYAVGLQSSTTQQLFAIPWFGVSFTQGQFGVTIFFFLSGYLITTLLRMEYERTGRISLRDFYLRRALRILPPLYVALAAGVLLTEAGAIRGWHVTPVGLLSQVLFFHNYYEPAVYPAFGAVAGTWVLWSLAVEEHFYLIFPVAYLALLRWIPSPRRQAAILLGVCGLVLMWRVLLIYHFHVFGLRVYMSTDTRIDSILFGCVLAIVENPYVDRSVVSDQVWKWVLLPLGLGGIAATWIAAGHVHFHETFVYTIQGACLVPLFVCAVRYPGWSLFRPLQWGWVRTVGLVSYVLYLVHDTVIIGVEQNLHAPRLVEAVVAVGLALVVALLVRKFVEVPCARLRRRLAHVLLGTTSDRRQANSA